MNPSVSQTTISWGLILVVLGVLVVVIALVAAAALLVKRRRENKLRSYRVELERLGVKGVQELLLLGKTPAQALENARQAGLIPGGLSCGVHGGGGEKSPGPRRGRLHRRRRGQHQQPGQFQSAPSVVTSAPLLFGWGRFFCFGEK